MVAQDAIVVEEDCGVKTGTTIGRISASGLPVPFGRSIRGRILSADAADKEGKVLLKKGALLTRADAQMLEISSIETVNVRSPMACKTLGGVCQHCYGIDLTTNHMIEIGEAVGTIAAQAIGEPGTQLTMNTKHAGGAASVGGDVTSGLPRVEEIFEKRQPKIPAVVSMCDGIVTEIRTEGKEKVIVVAPDMTSKHAPKKKDNIEYPVHWRRSLTVMEGETVTAGQILTDGSAHLPDIFKYGGETIAQEYIIAEINKIYELQGVSIARKHIELVVKQMMSRVKITHVGDSSFNRGDVIEEWVMLEQNERLETEGKDIAKGERLILGITETSLTRKSFLSAASFQNTTRVLISAAVRGLEDNLTGLMENVILGRLIPAGTGYKGAPKYEVINALAKELDAAAAAKHAVELAEKEALLATNE